MESLHLPLFHFVHEMHGDGLHMAVAIAMTDQKIMRDAGVFGDIKQDRLFGLLVFRECSQ
jgi:hypothetical protein